MPSTRPASTPMPPIPSNANDAEDKKQKKRRARSKSVSHKRNASASHKRSGSISQEMDPDKPRRRSESKSHKRSTSASPERNASISHKSANTSHKRSGSSASHKRSGSSASHKRSGSTSSHKRSGSTSHKRSESTSPLGAIDMAKPLPTAKSSRNSDVESQDERRRSHSRRRSRRSKSSDRLMDDFVEATRPKNRPPTSLLKNASEGHRRGSSFSSGHMRERSSSTVSRPENAYTSRSSSSVDPSTGETSTGSSSSATGLPSDKQDVNASANTIASTTESTGLLSYLTLDISGLRKRLTGYTDPMIEAIYHLFGYLYQQLVTMKKSMSQVIDSIKQILFSSNMLSKSKSV